jgi:hypothetical protein
MAARIRRLIVRCDADWHDWKLAAALVVARSQWLILGCFPSPTVALEGPAGRCPSPAGTGHDFEQFVNPAHRVLTILRTID